MIRSVQPSSSERVGCGGYANSAALLGAPDIELLTLTEMVDAVRFADAVDLALFAGGDTYVRTEASTLQRMSFSAACKFFP
jgi:2-methylisocitrate lyase-like PEP mutase family enzyme